MPRRKDTLSIPEGAVNIRLVVSPETHEKLRRIGFEHNLVLSSLVRRLVDMAVEDPKKYFPKKSGKAT